jgi:hypothetical protein
LIILDNFRIGGIQRHALDQLFALSDLGIQSTAYYRQKEATENNPNFLTLEAHRISEKQIKIHALPESNWAQLKVFVNLLKHHDFSEVINYSLGATVLLRISKIISKQNFKLNTIVEQLPTLSAPLQRFKRFLYAQTTDELYGYSHAVVRDWNDRVQSNLISSLFLGFKKPNVLRNGVYLNRLPKTPKVLKVANSQIRMIFIGRGVAWKNKDFIVESLRKFSQTKIKALLVLPSIAEEELAALKFEFGARIEFEIGKKIEDIEFSHGDINIYPVDYGHKAKFIESISINCLEMAGVGIPSLVTKHGVETWPELVESGIFLEVDWEKNEDFLAAIEAAAKLKIDLEKIRSVISIESNLKKLIVL